MSREMPLYKKYAETKAVGYYCMSNWGGLEILDLNDECAIAAFNFGGVRQQIRRHKVCYTNAYESRPYIRKQGRRFYLDQIMKV